MHFTCLFHEPSRPYINSKIRENSAGNLLIYKGFISLFYVFFNYYPSLFLAADSASAVQFVGLLIQPVKVLIIS